MGDNSLEGNDDVFEDEELPSLVMLGYRAQQTNKQTKMIDQHGARGCDEDDIGDDDGDDIGHDGDNDGGLTFEVGDVSSC